MLQVLLLAAAVAADDARTKEDHLRQATLLIAERQRTLSGGRYADEYSRAVVVWGTASLVLERARGNPSLKRETAEPFSPQIDEAIGGLRKLLDADAWHEEAMSFMILLLRLRAELRESPADARIDLQLAEQWERKLLDVRKMKKWNERR